MKFLIALLSLACLAHGQNVGTETTETHLPLTYQDCTSGSCVSNNGQIVLDANWRWTHKTDDTTNCYTGNEWDSTLCPDADTCTTNCAIDGVDQASWTSTYGISTSGDELSITFVTVGTYSTNVGSRVYLMDSDDEYKVFNLKNREFSFDVDDSGLDCGLNGALYFSEMEADGGKSEYSTNQAGAQYGTGYCDAQCPHDIKFIAGKANSEDWTPADNDDNSGTGKYGACCYEMDIWEANKMAQSFTVHDCTASGYHVCTGSDCGDVDADRYTSNCDKDGCDFAAYRNGQHDFYGPSKTVDSSSKITVITQFITTDGTDSGDLQEIRRVYKQNGVVIQNAAVNFSGVTAYDSITDSYCSDIKTYFGDQNEHAAKGGMKAMGDSMDRGHVLVMSLWDDHYANMLWLDSSYPTDGDLNADGVLRGPCATTTGVPSDVESADAASVVKFSNIIIDNINTY